jgi:hypothetical protein
MTIRKLLVAAASLGAVAFLWRRVRSTAVVDTAPPVNPAAVMVDDAVSAAVGTES